MHYHVSIEVYLHVKPLATQCALKSSLIVDQHVAVQVALHAKSLATQKTLKLLLTIVHKHMTV